MGLNPYSSGSLSFGNTAYTNGYPPMALNASGQTSGSPIFESSPQSGMDSFSRSTDPAATPNSNPNKPDLTFTDFNQLTPQAVQTQGNIRGMVFDIDDTLSKYKLSDNRSIPPELKQRLKALQDSGIQLGIVSNNTDEALVQNIQQELANDGIQVAVISNAQKPHIKELKKMQDYFGLPADQIMMVGDNAKTDVESGNNAGFQTAQVDWFNRSEVHKDAMQLGDKASQLFEKLKDLLTPGSSEPQLIPPPASSVVPVAAG